MSGVHPQPRSETHMSGAVSGASAAQPELSRAQRDTAAAAGEVLWRKAAWEDLDQWKEEGPGRTRVH